MGRNFLDIINKARDLGEYKDVYGHVSTLQNTLTYSGTGATLFIVIIIVIIVGRVLAKRGVPLLIRDRLISGNNPGRSETRPEPSVRNEAPQAAETRTISWYLPSPMGATLPNLHQLATVQQKTLQPLLMSADPIMKLQEIEAPTQHNQSSAHPRSAETEF